MLGEIHRTWLKLKLKITNINKNGKEKKKEKKNPLLCKINLWALLFPIFQEIKLEFLKDLLSLCSLTACFLWSQAFDCQLVSVNARPLTWALT